MLPVRITFLYSIILLLASVSVTFAQADDSLNSNQPFASNVVKNVSYLNDTTSSFNYMRYIWSDKRTISEVMNQRKGYFVSQFYSNGGRDAIMNNDLPPQSIGVFRDGIQLNDPVIGGIDPEVFSINEVNAIEEISASRSLLYGINSFGRSFNVITKDYFTPLPFSQLRFSQDRGNSLFADVFYSQALSKNFGFQIGVTNQNFDGRFINSAFSTWKSRTRISFYPNNNLNIKGNFYYNYLKRGLNGGVEPGSDNIDSMLSGDAEVRNDFNSEESELISFDSKIVARLFKNPQSLTKVNLYSQNILRGYSFKTSASQTNTFHNFYHSVIGGLNILQNIFLEHNERFSSDIIVGCELKLSKTDFGNTERSLNIYSIKTGYELKYNPVTLAGIYRFDRANDFNFSSFSIEGKASLFNSSEFGMNISTGIRKNGFSRISSTRDGLIISSPGFYTFEGGIDLRYRQLSFEFYTNKNHDNLKLWNENSFSALFSYSPEWMTFEFIYQYSKAEIYPENYVKGCLFYKGILFNGNLKLQTGFNYYYYNIEKIFEYDYETGNFLATGKEFPRKNQFNVDFFVGARIGSANVNLTIANIFNSLLYNAYIYPLDNRGGFLNSISRFTIVWDFLN
ncbi:MAG: hypothetical protein EDM69_05450 [Chlorobiota bacterium]|nr:MAG: hypothetical protein EDM69_05450 [Chlorobiota bacterium]MBV6398501.1 hypothetical protein [Ignavibacteria bacterium]MCE7953070.1 hypothetical protein [Chlorobi bacterium CHB7]RIK49888.1 MAG: hypothetical protein DCC60_02400 [Ignavibacteriota bacterium]